MDNVTERADTARDDEQSLFSAGQFSAQDMSLLRQTRAETTTKDNSLIPPMTLSGDTAQSNSTSNGSDGKSKTRTEGALSEGGTAKEAESSPFTEKYDKTKAAKLIEDLGSGTYKVREHASDTLKKMGPEVLPDLEKARKSTDPEVRRRANDAARFIERYTEEQRIGKYSDLGTAMEKAMNKAGFSVDKNLKQLDDELIGPSRLIADPKKGALSAEDRKSWESIIEQGDKLAKDPLFRKDAEKARSEGTRPDAPRELREKHIKMTEAGWAADDARTFYARALAGSNDPKDHQKSVELLTEQLKRDKKVNFVLTDTAARVGADKNETFMKLFTAAGGDVDELKETARQHRTHKR